MSEKFDLELAKRDHSIGELTTSVGRDIEHIIDELDPIEQRYAKLTVAQPTLTQREYASILSISVSKLKTLKKNPYVQEYIKHLKLQTHHIDRIARVKQNEMLRTLLFQEALRRFGEEIDIEDLKAQGLSERMIMRTMDMYPNLSSFKDLMKALQQVDEGQRKDEGSLVVEETDEVIQKIVINHERLKHSRRERFETMGKAGIDKDDFFKADVAFFEGSSDKYEEEGVVEILPPLEQIGPDEADRVVEEHLEVRKTVKTRRSYGQE